MSARPRKRGRRGGGAPQQPPQPSITRADLEAKKVTELREMAVELSLDVKDAQEEGRVHRRRPRGQGAAEGFVEISGILDVLPEGYGFIRTSGYLPGDSDVYCSMSQIRRGDLRRGDLIRGQVRPPKDNEKYPALQRIDTVNGVSPEEARGIASTSAISRRSTRTSASASRRARTS
jgi:transcription termination factor Rho